MMDTVVAWQTKLNKSLSSKNLILNLGWQTFQLMNVIVSKQDKNKNKRFQAV